MTAFGHAAFLAAKPAWVAAAWCEIAEDHGLTRPPLPRTDPTADDAWAAHMDLADSLGGAS